MLIAIAISDVVPGDMLVIEAEAALSASDSLRCTAVASSLLWLREAEKLLDGRRAVVSGRRSER